MDHFLIEGMKKNFRGSVQVKDLVRLSLKDPEYIAVHAEASAPTPLKLQQVRRGWVSACHMLHVICCRLRDDM